MHVHNGILFGHKEKGKCDICQKIDETCKVSQTEKDNYFMFYLIQGNWGVRGLLGVCVYACVCTHMCGGGI